MKVYMFSGVIAMASVFLILLGLAKMMPTTEEIVPAAEVMIKNFN